MNSFRIDRRTLMKASGAAVLPALVAPPAQAVGGAQAAAHAPAPAPAPATDMPTRLVVNGRTVELALDPRTTLLDALREHLGLTGTKKACDHGQCGACTVHVEGRRVNACLTLAVMHHGESITTIEGLGTPQHPHPMQLAFVERDGFQCGYCTPGQIMSALAVLQEARDGSPSHVTASLTSSLRLDAREIRERMSGNICRCAAYPNIVEAIQDVAGATL
jgi:xanthine dehydrogenase YagT iron-sulfur-binding subunit